MKIKKLLKYLPITVMATGLAVATSSPPLSLLNNSDYLKNQIFNVDQAVDETEYTDQLQYIRNDVAKQDGVTDSVASIKLSDNSSSLSQSSAAIVTKTDGSTLLYMWGDNGYGQLGNGSRNSKSTPTIVDSTPFGSKKITQIALGTQHSAALLEDGSLYMWGNNKYGQLGIETNVGTFSPIPTPTPVTALGGQKITKIALGYQHSAALITKTDGSTLLYMWGWNEYDQLGNTTNKGTANPNPTPTQVDATPFGTNKITQIALGYAHSAALVTKTDGSTLLYTWGFNQYGQLGSSASFSTHLPTLVTTLSGKTITQIALGEMHTAALLDDYSLYMWGANKYGQLGNGGTTKASIPIEVTSLSDKKIDQIALGIGHSAALLEDGSLYMWGKNHYGQLGFPANGDTPNPIPTLVDSTPFGTNKITQIALVYDHSAALVTKTDGSTLLYMWGSNVKGQLGFTVSAGANPAPTWMYKLGKDSHITANTTITAKEAVDNIWVDNKFNLTGFKNSFNLTNILETTDQEITMDTKPTYDNATGTVTMTVKIKYFYNADGLLVPDTAAEEMTFTGFVPVAAEDQNPATNNQDPFPWWWIIIGIGGAAIIGVGIWFVIKKRKEAEAKPADGEPDSEKPQDDSNKTSESEAKPAEETETEEASKPKSLKKTKK